jgi:hypothetical protein
MHHGISPVLIELAKQQQDYHVQFESRYLRYGLFGWPDWVGREFNYNDIPAIDDPILIQKVISQMCPNNGQTHVIIEGVSFPAGDDSDNTKLRVKRQRDWQRMSVEELSMSPTALKHPINLETFYEAYHPYATIKFIVLHRPHIETVGSHSDFDSSPIIHSKIIQGFLIILRNFLENHRNDAISGEKLWSVVRTERLAVRFYGPRNKRESHKSAFEARHQIVHDIATFLGWPQKECQQCFNTWQDSNKDYAQVFSPEEMNVLREHAKNVQSIWPPSES